jgi:hypothetical protein
MMQLAVLFVVCSFALPLFARAQTDLQSTIRAAIVSDPRSAQMSSAQVDAMVAALSQSAQKQGMTPADIMWRPQTPETRPLADTCGPYPAFLCLLNTSFGLSGPDDMIPLWLAICSLLFLLVNALLRHHERTYATPVAMTSQI